MGNDYRVNRGEINRLTKAIAAEEQNINNAFQQMGQTYFAAHRNDPEDAQRGYIQAVLDAMQRASAYKDQINVLRGIAICPNCKAEVDITAAFCSHCGTRMPAQTPPAPPAAPGAPICPNCGNACAPGTKFCNLCGTRLPEAAPAPAYAAPAPGYAPTPAPGYAPAPSYAPSYEPIPEPTSAPSYEPIPEPTPAPSYDEPTPEPVPMPEPVSASEPAEAEAPAQDQPADAEVKFCSNCGTPLEPGYRFCLECGTPVQQ